jgi:hypothetical protein
MKRLVSSILMANIFVSLWAVKAKADVLPHNEGDTVVVKLKNKNKVMIITEKEKDLKSLKRIDINQIISDIDSSFNKSSNGEEGGEVIINIGNRDSLLVIKKVNGSAVRKSYRAVIEIKDDNDTSKKSDNHHKRKWYHYNDDNDAFEIDLGWNNYLEDGALPGDNNKSYGLRPFNSNVVAFRAMKTLLKKKDGPFSLTGGLELAVNNYKYENEVIIRKSSESVTFEPFPVNQKMIKSKLAITWLNVPLMVHYRPRKSNFHLAVGGYAGYRLGSHSKIKYEENGSERKDKVHANFYLNSLQYGARLQIGFHDVDLFVTYNFNQLFSKDRGPALTPISFGFTL